MPPERKAIDVDNLIREYLDGTSINQLSKRLGIGRNVITRRLNERNVRLRDQSEAEFLKWALMDDTARERQVSAAHNTSRGRTINSVEQANRAIGVEVVGRMNPNEKQLFDWLTERNIVCTPQVAIGPYNCDLAAAPVAVEIFGGGWHWHGYHIATIEKRIRYLLNAGWHSLMIKVDTRRDPLTPAVADYVMTYIQEARTNPSKLREYRVIWRAGELSVSGRADDDKISIEPPFTNRRNPRTGQYERVAR